MSRSSGYSLNEDKLLCQIYVDISQDPITGICQSYDQFWVRIEQSYNNLKEESWIYRNKKSLQCRIALIEKAVRKLSACIRQIENLHPSGASDIDIVSDYFLTTYNVFLYIYLHNFDSYFCRLIKQKYYLCKNQLIKKVLSLIMYGI
ncbi:hypothetical protein RDI58_007479 [Solanum bulbocastanum]|uniref:Uncharacterized protein n=2 Tax=Solanum TaxID=4107 RepID=A0AAN8TYW8_SOLBU